VDSLPFAQLKSRPPFSSVPHKCSALLRPVRKGTPLRVRHVGRRGVKQERPFEHGKHSRRNSASSPIPLETRTEHMKDPLQSDRQRIEKNEGPWARPRGNERACRAPTLAPESETPRTPPPTGKAGARSASALFLQPKWKRDSVTGTPE